MMSHPLFTVKSDNRTAPFSLRLREQHHKVKCNIENMNVLIQTNIILQCCVKRFQSSKFQSV